MIQSGIKQQVLDEIKELARKHHMKKVILFGSRARGDYHQVSDIDLAVFGGNCALFSLDVEDDTSTLLKFDVVNMDGSVQEELRKAIEKEGVILYEEI